MMVTIKGSQCIIKYHNMDVFKQLIVPLGIKLMRVNNTHQFRITRKVVDKLYNSNNKTLIFIADFITGENHGV